MPNQITCPSCDATLTFGDDKRGKNVRCRKCEEVFKLPLAGVAKRKRAEEDAVQEGRKIRMKARARANDDDDEDEDDDEEERPSRNAKKAKKDKSGTPVLLLALGGGGLLLVLMAACGIGGWLLLGKSDQALAKAGPLPEAVQKDPEPIQKVKDEARVAAADPDADKPLPDNMEREAVERVRQATLYIRVTMADGQMGSGSGFLAIEKGLVVTNAHVVGMLKPNSRAPRKVEVVLHSGSGANELTMPGQVLGVDRTSDLAFIRVNHANLPPMLPLETKRKLFETQKVYVFGFPLGERLGKEITVSPSSVSSLRNDAKSGELEKIQVNGGMQPGNSGGPVVNSQGNVVGIAVSIIVGTQINFAIPVQKVQKAMEGRVSETTVGQAVISNGEIRLPVKVVCLDPLQRISKMRVEVWTGSPGAPRPYSVGQPQPIAGDGPRQPHDVKYQNGVGSIELPLPAASPGQVFWVQSVITNAGGTQWGAGVSSPIELNPIERKPANLTANFANVRERTVKLKSSQGLSVFVQNENKVVGADVMDVDLLEIVSIEPKDGYRIRTVFGAANLSIHSGGKNIPQGQPVVDLFRQVAPVYIVDPSNRFLKRVDRLLHPMLEKRLKEETQRAYSQLCNSAEAVMLNIPNRVMQPQGNWTTKLPLMVRAGSPGKGGGPEVVDLALTCTYEGTRRRGQREEAVITLTGKVQGRGANAQDTDGDVTGKLAFDLQGGFISAGKVKIDVEVPLPGDNGKDISANAYFDIELTRAPGNTMNIQIPPDTTGPAGTPPIIAKGKVLINAMAALQQNDPAVPPVAKLPMPNSRMKVQPIQMQAGKTYVISLDSEAFDAYLLLQDSAGKVVAEDDDSGGGKRGLNARIEFRCTQTGVYRILATALDAKLGPFQLKVQEAQ